MESKALVLWFYQLINQDQGEVTIIIDHRQSRRMTRRIPTIKSKSGNRSSGSLRPRGKKEQDQELSSKSSLFNYEMEKQAFPYLHFLFSES